MPLKALYSLRGFCICTTGSSETSFSTHIRKGGNYAQACLDGSLFVFDAIKYAIAKGVPVVISTRVPSGRVLPVYGMSNELGWL
jgi:hypothetical protein